MDKRQFYFLVIYTFIGLCSKSCFGQQTTPTMMNHDDMNMGATMMNHGDMAMTGMDHDHMDPAVTHGMDDMDHGAHGVTSHMDHVEDMTMDHGGMDHGDHGDPAVTHGMGHMDHGGHGVTSHMDHEEDMTMDHGGMDHGDHGDHAGDGVTMDHGGMGHGDEGTGGHGTGGHGMTGDTPHHGGAGGPFFYASNTVQLIFEDWETKTDKEMALSVFYVVLVAIFYEGLKAFRDGITTVESRYSRQRKEWSYKINHSSRSKCTCRLVVLHVFQSLLYMVHVFLSMCLMLFFMTFNAWIAGAVCVGAGLGYLCFGKLRKRINQDEESCH